MNTLGSRLRAAIDEWGSIRSFIRDARLQGVQGSSEPAVYRYLRDESSPKADFLEAASIVLAISIDWLVTGRNPGCSRCAMRERRVAEAVRLLTEP
jgi:transcriptional regulator with XRE-family HTH domain